MHTATLAAAVPVLLIGSPQWLMPALSRRRSRSACASLATTPTRRSSSRSAGGTGS